MSTVQKSRMNLAKHKWVLSHLVGALVLLCSVQALAVELQLQSSVRRAEVGQSFFVQLTALSDSGGATPSGPRLIVPPSFTAQGPSISTQQQVTILGGQIRQRQGITASWTVTGSRPGTFRIGPGSVLVGGQRIDSQIVSIELVAAGPGGSSQRRGSGSPLDPFDVFRAPGFPGFPGFDPPSETQQPDLLPPFPDEFRVERALDPTAFLIAKASPERVVVGEQVTFTIYAYGSRGPFREVNPTEPSRKDFLTYTLLDNSFGEQQHRVPISDTVWWATKVRQLALFPIRSSALPIGSMRMGFDGRGYPSSGPHKGLIRESTPLEVVVTEPPLAGRPSGYRLGDVGRYQLSVSVDPREVTTGDSISVVAKLEGIGNLPNRLLTPQRHGVEWLEPTIVDDIEPHGAVIGGFRKFSYVVRMTEAGRIDLGELSLPFFDAKRGAYDVARAVLGVVEVKPGGGGASPKANDADKRDSLELMIKPRTELGAPAIKPLALADRPWFWTLLFIGPASVIALSGGLSLGRRLLSHYRSSSQAHASRAGQALREARQALEQGDAPKAATGVERAVLTAIEGAVGLRARAVLRSELSSELEARRVSAELADELAKLLEACDNLRFLPEPAEPAASLVERAARAVEQLGRVRQSPPSLRGAA